MSVNSRDKGARYEREIAGILRARGYKAHRTAQYCGYTGDAADVIGLPGIHIECKHVEQMRLYDWMQQSIRDASGTGEVPVVFHRKNHADSLVTMRLSDWLDLYSNSDWPDTRAKE